MKGGIRTHPTNTRARTHCAHARTLNPFWNVRGGVCVCVCVCEEGVLGSQGLISSPSSRGPPSPPPHTRTKQAEIHCFPHIKTYTKVFI
jgi:hypothetical protein